MSDIHELRSPESRIPDIRLPSLTNGAATPLRSRRSSPLIILAHAAGCDACEGFLQAVALAHEEIRGWDGHPIAISGPAEDSAGGTGQPPPLPFPRLIDAAGRLCAELSIAPPAILVADQWGEVHELWTAGEEHEFPAIDDLLQSLRYLAIVCPECQGEAY